MSDDSAGAKQSRELGNAAFCDDQNTRNRSNDKHALGIQGMKNATSQTTFTPRATPLGQVDDIMELVRTSRITEAEILLRLYWPLPEQETGSRTETSEPETEPWQSVMSIDRTRPVTSPGAKQTALQPRRSKESDRDTGQPKTAEQLRQQRGARRTGAANRETGLR